MNKKKVQNQEVKEEKNEEVENLENLLKRALSDYQNLEKRIASEKGEWIKIANKDLLLKLLPGLDSLILAQKHTQDEGVNVSIEHFLDTLEQVGVKKISTENADFDPNLMEAIAQVDGPSGKVVEELRAGYTINGQVLRPAQVLVGKGENN